MTCLLLPESDSGGETSHSSSGSLPFPIELMRSLYRSRLIRWLADRIRDTSGRGTVELRAGIYPRLYPSRLEPRLVLDAVGPAGALSLLHLDSGSGLLTVHAGAEAGDSQADQFAVSYLGPDESGGQQLGITVNGRPVETFDTSQVQEIRIEGSADQDVLRLDAEVLHHASVELSGEQAATGQSLNWGMTAPRDTVELSSSESTNWLSSRLEFADGGGTLELTRQDGVISSRLHFDGVIDVFDSLSVADRHINWVEASQLNWQIDGQVGWWSSEVGSLATHLPAVTHPSGESSPSVEIDTDEADQGLSDPGHPISSWQIDASGAAVEMQDRFRVRQLTLDAGATGSVELSGHIDATSVTQSSVGGEVRLRAGDIRLLENATIDVSGHGGGGRIEIGGQYRGLEDGFSRSQFTFVGNQATLLADATSHGDGGTVIVWSDIQTVMAGTITARGGNQAGNGGLVEVSGREHLWLLGDVDTTATHGVMGTFLLDPSFINIVEAGNGSGDLDGELDRNTDFELLAAVPDTTNNEVSTGQLEHFREGAHVILEATGDITLEDLTSNLLDLDLGWDGSQRGSLTLRSLSGGVLFQGSDDVVRTGGGSLIIEAAADVVLNAEIRSSRGDVDVTSSGGQIQINHAGGIDSNDGNISLTAATSVELGGDLDASGPTGHGSVQITGDLNLLADVAIDGLDITISGTTNTSNDLSLTAENGVSTGAVTSGVLTVTATTGDVAIGGDLNVDSANISAAAGDVSLDDTQTASGLDVSGNLLTLTGSTMDVSTSGTIDLTGAIVLATDLTVNAPGNVTINGTIDSQTTAQSLSVNSLTGNVSLSGATGTTTALSDLTLSGDAVNLADVGTAVAAGATGAINVTATSISLDGSVVRNGTGQTFNGNVTVASATETLLLHAEGTLFSDWVWVTGEINDSNGTPSDLTIRTFGFADILLNSHVGNSTGLGTIQLQATDGDVMMGGSIDAGSLTVTGSYVQFAGAVNLTGTLTVTAQHDLTVQQNVLVTGAIDLRANQSDTAPSGFFQSSDTVINTSAATASALLIDVGDSGMLRLASVAAVGEVVLRSGGTIEGLVDTGTDVIADTLTLTATDNVTLATEVADLTAVINGLGSLTLHDSDQLNVHSVAMLGGDVGLTASAMTVGEITTLGAVTLTATSGAIANDANTSTTISGTSLTATAVSGIDIDSSTSDLDLTVSSAGDVQVAQTVTDLNLNNLAISSGSLDVTANHAVYVPISLANLTSLSVDATGLVDFAGSVNVSGTVQVNAGENLSTSSMFAGDSVTLSGLAVTLGSTVSTTGGISVTSQDSLLLSDTLDAGDGLINLETNQDSLGSQGLTQTAGTIQTSNSSLQAVTITAAGTGGTAGLSLTLSAGGVRIDVGGAVIGDGLLARDILATTLDISAGTDVDLDTEVVDLSVRSTSAGQIDIQEFDAVDVTELSTVDGAITLEADGNVRLNDVDSGTGNIELTSTSGSLTAWFIGPPPQIVGNSLTLRADSGIDLQTTVSSVNAEVVTAGNLTLQESTSLTIDSLIANVGDVSVTAGSIGLGYVSSSSTVGLTTSTGGITDDNGASVNVIASDLEVSANGAAELDTTVVTLQVSTSAAGDVTIRETDDLQMDAISVTAGGLDVEAASLTVGSVSASATVSLTTLVGDVADGNAGSMNVTSDELALQSAGIVTLDTNIDTLSGLVGGNLTLTESDALTVDGLTVSGTTATVSAQSFSIRSLSAVNAHVDLQSAGVIVGEVGGVTDVIAQTAMLRAADTVNLTTALTSLDVDISGVGDLTIHDDDALTVLQATTAGSAVDLEASDLIVHTIASANSVQLTARTSGVADGNGIATNVSTGSLTVASPGAVDLDTAVDSIDVVVGSTGDIDIDDVDALTASRATTASGNIHLTATELVISEVNASNQLHLTATSGGISRDTALSVNVTGGTLDVSSVGGVHLHTQVDSLQSMISGTGNLTIEETDAIDILSANVADGNLVLNNLSGQIDLFSLVATNGSMWLHADDVQLNQTLDQLQSIQANLTGDLTLAADMQVSGPINLITAGSIIGDGTTAVDISVNQLSIQAGTGVDLDIDVNVLSASVTGTGDLNLREADAVLVTTLGTADGNLTFRSGGNIQIGGVVGTGGQITIETTSGTLVSNGGREIAGNDVTLLAVDGINVVTDAGQLDATVSGTGALQITDTASLTLRNVSTFDGDLSVIAGDLQVETVVINGSANLTTNAGGIADANAGSLNITANDLATNSAGNVELDTNVGSFNGSVTATGNLVIRETGDLQVDSVSVTDGGAEFVGDIVHVGTIDATGTVTLHARSGGIVDTNGTNVNVTAGALDLQILADATLQTDVGAIGGTVGGAITVAETDALTVDGLTLSGGNVALSAESFLFRSMSGAGDIDLQATGAILGEVGGSVDLAGHSLTAIAGGQIDLTTDVAWVDAEVTGTGNISVVNQSTLTVTRATTGSGDITLAGSTLTLNTLVQTDGTVALTATSGGVLDINGAGVDVVADRLIIASQDSIDFQTDVNRLQASVLGTGHLTITETDGLEVESIEVVNGDASLQATQFTVGEISASGQTDLVATAGGISRSLGITPNVTSALLTVQSTAGVDLHTAVGVVTASISGPGNLQLSEADSIDVQQVQIADGDLLFSASTGTAVIRTVTLAGTRSADLQVANVQMLGPISAMNSLTIHASGDIDFDAPVTASGNIVMTAGGQITDDSTGATDLTAASLDVTAVTGIDIDVDVPILAARASGVAVVDVTVAGTADVSELTSGGGVLHLSAGGNLRLRTVQSGGGDINITSTGGSVTGWAGMPSPLVSGGTFTVVASTGIDLATDVTALVASTISGSILVVEQNGLTADTVVANAGMVNLQAGELLVGSIQSSGQTNLTTTSGGIADDNAAAMNLVANGVQISAAGGVDLDIDAGSVSLTTTDDGAVHLSESGTLEVLPWTVANGDVTIVADQVDLHSVTTPGTLTLHPLSGGVNDLNGASLNVTAASLDLQGSGGTNLDTDVGVLSGNFTGDTTIQNSSNLTIQNLTITSGSTEISGPNITVGSLAASNTIDLQATGTILRLGGIGIDVVGTHLSLQSGGNVDLATSVDTLDANVTGGDLQIDESDSISIQQVDTDGDVNLSADAIGVGQITTIGTVTLTTRTGGISDENGSLPNVTADRLIIASQSDVQLDTSVNELVIDIADDGNAVVENSVAAQVSVSIAGVGNVNVSSDQLTIGQIDVNGNVDLTATSGSIARDTSFTTNVRATQLTTQSTGDVTLHTEIVNLQAGMSGPGNLAIQEVDDLTVGSLGLSGGNATISSQTGSIFIEAVTAPGSSLQLDAQNIHLGTAIAQLGSLLIDADANVFVQALAQMTGLVQITAGGTVTGDGSNAIDLSASTIDIIADSDIDLDLETQTLSAVVSGAGTLTVDTFGSIDIESLVNANGSIYVTGTDTIQLRQLNAGSSTAVIQSFGGSVSSWLGGAPPLVRADNLIVEASAGIDLISNVNNFTGSVSGVGSISIVDQDDVVIDSASVTAGDLQVQASGNLGIGTVTASSNVNLNAVGGEIADMNASHTNVQAAHLTMSSRNDAELDTSIDTLDATITHNGTLRVSEVDGLMIQSMAVASGDAIVSADSMQIQTANVSGLAQLESRVGDLVDTGAVSPSLSADTLMLQVAGRVDLDTSVGVLNGQVTGDLQIDEQDDLFVQQLDIGGTSGTITAGFLMAEGVTVAGTLQLTSGSQIVGVVGGSVDVTANSLLLQSDTDITLTSTVESVTATSTGGGNIELDDTDALSIQNVSTSGGNVTIVADDLQVHQVSAGPLLQLTARNGSVTDENGSAVNATADSIQIQSDHSVELDTDADTITVNVTEYGDIVIRDIATTAIDTAVTPAGSIEVAASELTVVYTSASELVDLRATAGAILSGASVGSNVVAANLFATAVDGVELETSVSDVTVAVSGTGDVTIHESDDLTVTSISVAGGNVEVTSDTGDLDLFDITADDALLSLEASNVHLQGNMSSLSALEVQASGDVQWSVPVVVNGNATIHANGELIDDGSDAIDLTAERLELTAGADVDLDVQVDVLNASTTGPGDLIIDELDQIDVERLATHDGFIQLTAPGDIRVLEVDSGTRDLTLTSINGSLVGWVAAGTPLVRGSAADLQAATGIDLDTDLAVLRADVDGIGSLAIRDQGMVDVQQLVVTGGDADLSTGGSSTVHGVSVDGIFQLTSGGSVTGSGTTDVDVVASTFAADVQGNVELRTNVGVLSIESSTSGDIRVVEENSLQTSRLETVQGDIQVEVETGNFIVSGPVLTPDGEIELSADSGNLVFFNEMPSTTHLIQSLGPNAAIRAYAGNNVYVDGPGNILFQTPDSQYLDTRPNLTVTPREITGFPDVHVGLDGRTEIEVSFGTPIGPSEQFFRLIVNWGDSVEVYDEADVGSTRLPLQRGSAASGDEYVYLLTHEYLTNPTGNSAAPIPITLQATQTEGGGTPSAIQFFAAGDPTTPLSTLVQVTLRVPSSGLAVSVSTPEFASIPTKPIEVVREFVAEATPNISVDGARTIDTPMTVTEAPTTYERYYVLRIVVLVDEDGTTQELDDIRIDDSYVRNLPELFELLPDDRYRLYQIREDGVAQMVTDVQIQGGKSAGVVELEDEGPILTRQGDESGMPSSADQVGSNAAADRRLEAATDSASSHQPISGRAGPDEDTGGRMPGGWDVGHRRVPPPHLDFGVSQTQVLTPPRVSDADASIAAASDGSPLPAAWQWRTSGRLD